MIIVIILLIFIHHMKCFYPYFILAMLVWPAVVAYSQDMQQPEVSLQYDLRAGETYLIHIDLQQTTQSESVNSKEISLFSKMKLEFRVDSTGDPNLIHMTVRYRDLLLSMLAPGLGIDINSGTGKNTLLTRMVDSLQNAPFSVTMTASGELRSLRGLGPIFTTLQRLPVTDTAEQQVILRTLGEVYGPDSFRSLFNLFISVYPVIQPIRNWTRDITYFFNTKPVEMSNRYHLTKTTEQVMTIQGLGILNSRELVQEKTSLGEVESGVTGSQTYDFQMDRENGWLRRCVSRQRVMIETTVLESSYLPKGLKIPSYTETLFEVKGSRLN